MLLARCWNIAFLRGGIAVSSSIHVCPTVEYRRYRKWPGPDIPQCLLCRSCIPIERRGLESEPGYTLISRSPHLEHSEAVPFQFRQSCFVNHPLSNLLAENVK